MNYHGEHEESLSLQNHANEVSLEKAPWDPRNLPRAMPEFLPPPAPGFVSPQGLGTFVPNSP